MRTGNPIESVIATDRHRTVRTKGALSQKFAKLMVFKLIQAAAKTWRRLKDVNQLPLVTDGVAENRAGDAAHHGVLSLCHRKRPALAARRFLPRGRRSRPEG